MSYAQPLLLLGASGQLGSELRRLLDAAGLKGENLHCHKQMREQLALPP